MFLHQLCASYSVKVRLYCQGKSIVKHLCAIAVWLRWALEACSFDWLWTSADLVASLASFSSASWDRSPLLLSVGQGFLPQPQSFLVCISYNSFCLLYPIDWNRFHVYDIFFFSATKNIPPHFCGTVQYVVCVRGSDQVHLWISVTVSYFWSPASQAYVNGHAALSVCNHRGFCFLPKWLLSQQTFR